MKTTIDLPDELLQRAKIAAARRRTTLKELVVQGLEYATTHAVADSDARDDARALRLLEALQATNTVPMKPFRRDEIHDR